MSKYPTKSEIQTWISPAIAIFQSIMPPINIPYPLVYIANKKNWRTEREKLVKETDCKHIIPGENSIMEYIHGDKGYGILIRQDLFSDNTNDEIFCTWLWHELGHFYAINSEQTNLHHC